MKNRKHFVKKFETNYNIILQTNKKIKRKTGKN